ncbi:LysR family transcriptional regulator [Kitasatospora sp. NBC_01287]|uniref:LysR family transcriptional regulator n=1 Tax=Kitasatospora sp. NBC_01287 TaxID=2903573 RepID=UPI002253089E|nr:LysR family transcriptional regulator [Kitasatospora sp. NBC_01287]MCX4745698.1 LysR family transcriptional regulator [Kitasatospora sp. NBC_01287]
MELRTLEYFVAVAEEASFTRAAARFHLAQPAISQQIRSLERELGEPLFERSSRRVRLNPAGEALLPYARRMLADASAVRAEFAARSGLLTGTLALGAVDGVEHTELPSVLGAFHRHHPGVGVRLIGGTSAELIGRVRQGTLDAAVVALPREPLEPALRAEVLLRDEVVAVRPAAEVPAGHAELPLTELDGVPLITYAPDSGLRPHLESAFRAAGAEFRPLTETNDVALQAALVLAGIGTALSAGTDRALRDDDRLVLLPLRPRVHYAKALVWRTDPAPVAPLRALLALRGQEVTLR